MRRSPATALAILMGLVLLAAWAFNMLLGKRFASGEVYAHGSSLRADPMGTKALHDSLNRIPGVRAERNYRDLSRLKGSRDMTLLLVMVTPAMFADGGELDGESVLRFANEGGRVVIALHGQKTDWNTVLEAADRRRDENAERRRDERRKKMGKPPLSDEKKKKEKGKDDDEDDEDIITRGRRAKDKDDPMLPPQSLKRLLGVKVNQQNFVMTPGGALKLTTPMGVGVEEGLPDWHTRTSISFTDEVTSKWKPLAMLENDVVLASRDTDAGGSIVLATDSYFLSNEALYHGAATKFLSWLIGPSGTVIFDETHLGTLEQPGIMALAKRHRLHGLFLGGLLLFALFVWKSSMSLVPARDDDAPSRTVAGRGATAGLVSLLRRGIPQAQVLRRGLDAWEHGSRHRSPAMQARIDQARQHLPVLEATSVRRGALSSLYHVMCEMLHPRPNQPLTPAPKARAQAPAPSQPEHSSRPLS